MNSNQINFKEELRMVLEEVEVEAVPMIENQDKHIKIL